MTAFARIESTESVTAIQADALHLLLHRNTCEFEAPIKGETMGDNRHYLYRLVRSCCNGCHSWLQNTSPSIGRVIARSCTLIWIPLGIAALTACGTDASEDVAHNESPQREEHRSAATGTPSSPSDVPSVGEEPYIIHDMFPSSGEAEQELTAITGFLLHRLDVVHGGAHDVLRVQYSSDGIIYDEHGNALLRVDRALWDHTIPSLQQMPTGTTFWTSIDVQGPSCGYFVKVVDHFVLEIKVAQRYDASGTPID